jgi:hypothetical protein
MTTPEQLREWADRLVEFGSNESSNGISAQLRAHADALEKLKVAEGAMHNAMNELGVPGDGYPAPVANAYDLLKAALARIRT